MAPAGHLPQSEGGAGPREEGPRRSHIDSTTKTSWRVPVIGAASATHLTVPTSWGRGALMALSKPRKSKLDPFIDKVGVVPDAEVALLAVLVHGSG